MVDLRIFIIFLFILLSSCNSKELGYDNVHNFLITDVTLIENSIYEPDVKLVSMEIINKTMDTIDFENFLHVHVSINTMLDTTQVASLVIIDNNKINLFKYQNRIESPSPPNILFTDSAYKLFEYYEKHLFSDSIGYHKVGSSKVLKRINPLSKVKLNGVFTFSSQEINSLNVNKLVSNKLKGYFVFKAKYYINSNLSLPKIEYIYSDTSFSYQNFIVE